MDRYSIIQVVKGLCFSFVVRLSANCIISKQVAVLKEGLPFFKHVCNREVEANSSVCVRGAAEFHKLLQSK